MLTARVPGMVQQAGPEQVSARIRPRKTYFMSIGAEFPVVHSRLLDRRSFLDFSALFGNSTRASASAPSIMLSWDRVGPPGTIGDSLHVPIRIYLPSW